MTIETTSSHFLPRPRRADFLAALGEYKSAAKALAMRDIQRDDAELDQEMDRLNAAGIALVEARGSGLETARALLSIAIERLREHNPVSFDLAPDEPLEEYELDASEQCGIGDRLDIALLTAALQALGGRLPGWVPTVPEEAPRKRSNPAAMPVSGRPANPLMDSIMPDGRRVGDATCGEVDGMLAVLLADDPLLPCGTRRSQASEAQLIAARQTYEALARS